MAMDQPEAGAKDANGVRVEPVRCSRDNDLHRHGDEQQPDNDRHTHQEEIAEIPHRVGLAQNHANSEREEQQQRGRQRIHPGLRHE